MWRACIAKLSASTEGHWSDGEAEATDGGLLCAVRVTTRSDVGGRPMSLFIGAADYRYSPEWWRPANTRTIRIWAPLNNARELKTLKGTLGVNDWAEWLRRSPDTAKFEDWASHDYLRSTCELELDDPERDAERVVELIRRAMALVRIVADRLKALAPAAPSA